MVHVLVLNYVEVDFFRDGKSKGRFILKSKVKIVIKMVTDGNMVLVYLVL
jgi:hypothetical protein